ncbi:CHAT domain-containing protein [Mycena epipterygia]|nr:CHAT domain-containing protein [Mycena epipterygia]
MADSSIANLNTAIYLLAQTWDDYGSKNSECLVLLSTALLTRFSYTRKWADVQLAIFIYGILLIGSTLTMSEIQDFLSNELALDSWHRDESSSDIVAFAGNILGDFHQSVNLANLSTAIALYEEALSGQDPSDLNTSRARRQLANANLIQFRMTGDTERIDRSISLLRQVHAVKPNQALCLCAALLTKPDHGNMLDATRLIQEALKSENQALALAKTGSDFVRVFNETGDELNLEMGISALEIAAAQLAWGHEQYTSVIRNFAVALHRRFDARHDPADMDNAISLYREALDLCPAPHSNCHGLLKNLAHLLQKRFQIRGDAEDLDNAIRLDLEALDLHPAPHPDHGKSLINLGLVLHKRFQTRGDPADMDNAIRLHCEALDSCAASDRHGLLQKLANLLHERFQTRRDAGDLDNAIKLHREALALCPAPHPDRGMSLTNLALVLSHGGAKDLNDAVELHREALNLCPAPHPFHARSLINLGLVLHMRFQTRGNIADMDNAIGLQRKALDLHPAPHPYRSDSLNNLANLFHERSRARHDAGDLDNAIELHREALALRPAPHPDRAMSLNNLGAVLLHRGGAENLNDAIELGHEALDLCPVPHPDRGLLLNSLAAGINARFHKGGDTADLDNSIELHREALNLQSAPDVNRGMSLSNLASELHVRFYIRGNSADLNNSIQLYREAVHLFPSTHPDYYTSLNNLAHVLRQRFEIDGQMEDINSSIELQHEALDLCLSFPPAHADSLNMLAIGLRQRFERTGDVADLDNSIRLHQESLELVPDNGTSSFNLANALSLRFQERGQIDDLDSAIRIQKETLAIYQPPHLDRGHVLKCLARSLICKYDNSEDSNTMEEAVMALREASEYIPSRVSERYHTAALWAHNAEKRNHFSALEAYQTAIELIPQLAMVGLDIQSRQEALKMRLGHRLVMTAATCASQLNEMGKAVEFLEAGRSVFWSQALQLHPSVDDLRVVHPELAERLLNIARKLEAGSHRSVAAIRMLPPVHKDHIMLEKDDTHYRKLNAEWFQVLDDVRQQPGFDRFSRPKLLNELKQAAIHGPIVIINAATSACTAFIVTRFGEVQGINLVNMTWDRAQLLVDLLRALLNQSPVNIIQTLTKIPARETSTLEFSAMQERLDGRVENSENLNTNKVFEWLLAELWTCIVEPVFHALELKKSDNPSRLWWCPTGPFTFLPIHAAGIYGPLGTDCVSDYVVSSYTPTLTTLLDPSTQTALPFKMTAVIQPMTDNCSDLPATVEELAQIKTKVPAQWLTSLGDATPATVNIALHHLQQSSIVHFACHGTQDLGNPLKTGLHLTDGRLKVSQLIRGKSQKKSMSLAFLSACETAKGDETVPDEAMHLAATLLFSGFQGVVATMWTMADADGPKIAESFYEHLFEDCDAHANPPILPDLTKAAEALHIAVAKLRADPNVLFSRWVPFVHYGL